MERKDTSALLDLKVMQPEHQPNLNESVMTEMSEQEENPFDTEAFQNFRQSILKDPELGYQDNFEKLIDNQLLYVASVDLDQIAEEERKMVSDQELAQKKNLEEVMKRNSAIKSLESQAKARLLSQYMERERKLKKSEKSEKKGFAQRGKNIVEKFKEAKKYLGSIVSAKKNYSKIHIGKLKQKPDMEIVQMSRAKKKLYIKIELCRALKDKLPCAHYAILVSLWDRLGGTKMEFSKKKRITDPVQHGGRYFNNCLRFEQTLELDIPTESKLASSMALSFELFMLKNKTMKFDKVVAYSYFPLINSDFQVTQGKFKTTMMKGAVDMSVEKYSDMEAKYRRNIDDWLCNMYFATKLSEAPVTDQLKLPEQYEEYQFSVTGPDGLKNRWKGWKRLKYVLGEVFQDLGFKVKKASYMQIWLSLTILLFALWICRLCHYFGQWLYLHAVGVSVSKFEILWFTFRLEYASDLYFIKIVFMLVCGSLFSIIMFGIFCGTAFLFYWYKNFFPTIGYRIGVLFGVAIIIDPVVTLVESVIISPIEDDWKRDPFLMSIYFKDASSSNFYGPLITILIYVALSGFSAFIVYMYLVYIHMNGRILDTYNRINSLESAFMVPYDAEVGERYLKWVIQKAHKFRTTEGDRRKVATACNIEKKKNEAFYHIAIYNEGRRKSLYRHFMKLPNGAIIELSTNRMNMFADDENN